MEFFMRLREIRKHLKLSQSDLANEFGVNQKTISHWEQGRNEPSINFISTFCTKYNVNPIWLLTGQGNKILHKNQILRQENLQLIPEVEGILTELNKSTNRIKDKIIQLNDKIKSSQVPASPIREEPTSLPSVQAADNYHRYVLVEGRVACGTPHALAEDCIIDYIYIPKHFKIRADFVIETKGESMVEYGIFPGMLVFIKKQQTCNSGDLVALSIYQDGEVQMVLKKASGVFGKIVYMNGKGGLMEPDDAMEIIGVVTFWMSDYRKNK